MSNRRTSTYTIRVADQATTDLVADGLRSARVPVVDHGDAAVSFRAPDDEAALAIAYAACSALTLRARPVTLTTGLGVHRREVVRA